MTVRSRRRVSEGYFRKRAGASGGSVRKRTHRTRTSRQKERTAAANLLRLTTSLGCFPQDDPKILGHQGTQEAWGAPFGKRSSRGLTALRAALAIALSILSTPAMADPQWLSRAMEDVGRNPTGWSHQWCAFWLDSIMPNGAGNLSGNWSSYGRPSPPRPGAVAVMRGHVGIVGPEGCNAKRCQVVSGNHSGRAGRRSVGIGYYPMQRILTFRWPHQ